MKATLRFHANVSVAKAGYEWSGDDWQASLVYKESVAEDVVAWGDEDDLEYFRVYDPFVEETALFRKFADVETLAWPPERRRGQDVGRARESTLCFANNYGVPYVEGVFTESISREIHYMRAAIELWEAWRADDARAISKYVQWNRRDGWSLTDTPICGLIAEDVPESWSDAPGGKTQALLRAEEIVAMIIRARCGDELQIEPVRRSKKPLELWIKVGDLLGVLWVQFALAVAGDKRYRRCKVCVGPFEIAPRENRADRRFCSDACRIKAYRHRMAQAQEMRAAGTHLRTIAKELHSDMETVRGWVGEE